MTSYRSSEYFRRCNIFSEKQEPVVAHHGIGTVFVSRILSKENISGACNFIDFTTLPIGTSIGRHSHRQNEEEYYLLIEGDGLMTVEDEEFEVGPGDLIRNPPGGRHDLRNTGSNELKLFVFELQIQ